MSALLLPAGSVLLHIGPSKTGTTAIQQALYQSRPKLAEYGVLHAGRGVQPMRAVLGLRGVKPLVGYAAPRKGDWEDLADQVSAAAGQRIAVSSEFFADANTEHSRRAVRDLGGSRVHVVVTLRPLTKILSSQWQQYVRNRLNFTYDEWLVAMLRKPPNKKPTPTFWHRHNHDVLVERWASIVGPENVTVIVPDEADRAFLLRRFEELLGLPSGLLVAERSNENRSLTLGEIELVRQMNTESRRNGWPDDFYRHVVRMGVGAAMQTSRAPAAGEPRIVTPQWALDRATEIGAAAAEKLSALGVRIVGDISTLGATVVAEEPAEAIPANSFVAVEAAREAVMGTIMSSGLLTKSPLVEATSTKELLREVLGRGRRRIRKATGQARRGPRQADQ